MRLINLMSQEQFKLIDCPNCNGNGHGTGGPGFEQIPPMAAVMANCLICRANGKLAICFQCNTVSSYLYADIMNRNGDKFCRGCNARLVVSPPPKCQIHPSLVQDPDGTIRCQVCRTVFTETLTTASANNSIPSKKSRMREPTYKG